MKQEPWLADEVVVTVSGVFTTHHLLQTEAGILGALRLPALAMTGSFSRVDGRELVVKRTSWWRRTYELQENGTVIGTGRPLGVFGRENVVRFGDQTYWLRAAGLWGRVWHLLDAGGEVVVVVCPRGAFRRGATLRILQPVDVALLVFTYHLVNTRWQEQTAIAGASAAT